MNVCHALRLSVTVAALLFLPKINYSQVTDTVPFHEMSLEQLMDVNVSVASHLPMTARESPGVLTILTRDEIQKTGAKDLVDLLRIAVPAFDFGVDVQGTVGMGVRGNWGAEGKVLMLWDGMELNEELYSTLQLGNHYPVNQIYQLEIIRGPGSAMYGGNAEYAVINIITINNKNLNGVVTEISDGEMSKTFSSRSAMIATGTDLGQSHINLSAHINSGNRSQRVYTDYAGNKYDMTNQSGLMTAQYRGDFFFKNLSATVMTDQHSIYSRDGYDAIYKSDYKLDFNSVYGTIKYDFKAGKNSITPGYKFKYSQPYCFKDHLEDDLLAAYNSTAIRNEFYVHGNYISQSFFDLNYGINYNHVNASENVDSSFFYNGTNTLTTDNYAAFLQGTFRYKNFNFLAGTRYNDNSRYESSFVPRLALTAVFDGWHSKILFSKGFRAPSVENINRAPGIKPENTTVAEVELGHRLGRSSYITGNIFRIRTTDPIVFFYDSLNVDSYRNDNTIGTNGVEIEYKLKHKHWYSTWAYSYFYSTSLTDVVSVPADPSLVRAFPQHKISALASVMINKHINITPSAWFVSTRYGSTEMDGVIRTQKFSPSAYFNLNLRFENIVTNGLNFEFGVFNLTDEEIVYIQPYDGNHAPLPGISREFHLSISYRFENLK